MNIDPQDKANVQEILRQGAASRFWEILCDAIDDSIHYLQGLQDGDEINELSPEQYKVQNEVLKAKRANLKKLKEMPLTLSEYLNDPNAFGEKNYDPYYTSEELAKELGIEHSQ